MYSHNNPYAQAGWVNTPSWGTSSSGQPSVYGALPGHSDIPKEIAIGAGPLKFKLHKPSAGYPSILNSTLMTPRNMPYLEIVTDKNTTYFRNLSDYTCIASIHWGSPATICITGTHFNGYPAGRWLTSSSDGGHTLLSQENKQYKWMPHDHQISLYSMVQGHLASIEWDQRSVTLNLTSEAAVKVGMLTLVISTVLLQSGRRFDQ